MKRTEIIKQFAGGADRVEDGTLVHYPSNQHPGKIDTYRRTATGYISQKRGW